MTQPIKKRRRRRNRNGSLLSYAGILGVILLVVLLASLGRGVSHGSPQKVVTSLWNAYGKGNEKQVKDCYGQKKDTSEALQAQITATMNYIAANEARRVSVRDCDILSENGDVTYVYVIYDLILEDGQAYPCLSTHMVRKEGKRFYLIPPEEITDSMQERAVADFDKFTTMDVYKKFGMDYNTFKKKNPGYEDRIAAKLELEF